MKQRLVARFAAALLAAAGPAPAATLHVWTNSPSPGPPFDDWNSAARSITQALAAAGTDDTILATDGVYRLTAELVITQAIALVSVNGYPDTVLDAQYPLFTNRCINLLHTGATVRGFTLTGGRATNEGGGVRAALGGGRIEACRIVGNHARDGGGVYGGLVISCLIESNTATMGGGGTTRGTIHDSTIRGNRVTAGSGGGASSPDLMENCVVFDNEAWGSAGGVGNGTYLRTAIVGNRAGTGGSGSGGGAYGGEFIACLIASNSAPGEGGGLYGANAYRCRIEGNTGGAGGGSQGGSRYNCVLIHNEATGEGGGARNSQLFNCTVISNRASNGGGTAHGFAHNCILMFNHADTAETNHYGTSLAQCLTVPFGAVTNDPLLVFGSDGLPRLDAASPAVDAGTNALPSFYIGNDYDGVSRPLDGNHDGTNRWDIGAFEYVHPLADSDGDTVRDPVEVWSGSDATNRLRHLRMEAGWIDADAVWLRWQSETNRTYRVERTAHLSNAVYTVVASNLVATHPINTYGDTNSPPLGAVVHRVMME